MISERELMKNNDDESIKDEQVRKDIQILSARLYDLRERFMKIIHKINNDSIGFDDQISEEDDTNDEESSDEMSVDDEDSDSTSTSSDDDDVKQTPKSKIRIGLQKLIIESILEHKARRSEYIKHIIQYPKILKYLINDDPNCINIPLRYLEPFIKDHVNKNPNGKIYDKVNQQIQDIRLNYLKNRQ